MKISGFTYVRNGIKLGYPFIPSILSLLPAVDELVVVVGDSQDGTREAIEALKNEKIRIVDVVWDMNLREGGKIFAQQANKGLEEITGDWAVHLQADEILHESAPEQLRAFIQKADQREDVDGLLMPFLHFWGDFQHIRHTRRTHRFEIRAFKNIPGVYAYRDSQGFRKYSSRENYLSGEKGKKLTVLKTDITVFHYSYARNPKLLSNKMHSFFRFWHSDQWMKKNVSDKPFDFNNVDKLKLFTGEHPKYMKEVIARQDWEFNYDPSKSNIRLKDRPLYFIEKKFGYRMFEYRNYISPYPFFLSSAFKRKEKITDKKPNTTKIRISFS